MDKTQQVNLLRPAVGITDMTHLHEIQRHFRTRTHEGQDVVVATTRRLPRQKDDILACDGSMYWIIKNTIQARQKIIALDLVEDTDGETYCQILMDPQIIRVSPRKKRAFQGWRYFKGTDVPEDIGPFSPSDDELPAEMAEELRSLGII